MPKPAEPTVTMPSGETIPCSELLDLAKAANLCDVSRQSLANWCNGEGRGKGRPLKAVKIAGSWHTTEEWTRDFISKNEKVPQHHVDALKEQVKELEAKLRVAKRRSAKKKVK
jgi:hypothetical protein